MIRKEIAGQIILSDIQNYCVADRDVENLYYKALESGVHAVLIGASSLPVARRFASRQMNTVVAAAYPSGAVSAELKAFEVQDAQSAFPELHAIFVTAAMGVFQSGHADVLREEMRACVEAAKAPVWFMAEFSQMTEEQIGEFCAIAKECGVFGVVTSVDFYPYELPAAGPEEIRALREVTGLKIAAPTASGEEKDWQALLDAGADLVVVNVDRVPAGD